MLTDISVAYLGKERIASVGSGGWNVQENVQSVNMTILIFILLPCNVITIFIKTN